MSQRENVTLPESQCIEEMDSQQNHVYNVDEDYFIDDTQSSLDEKETVQIAKEDGKELQKVDKNPETMEKEVKEISVSDNLEVAFGNERQFEYEVKLEDELPVRPEERTLPLEKAFCETSDKALRFFWWDAVEGPPGTVYIFGKVKYKESYVSCCVTVKNIERQIFLLPRKNIYLKTGVSEGKTVSIKDVHIEFCDEVAKQHKIFEFKTQKVLRKYAFDVPNVPFSSEYMEVKYPAIYGALPQDLSGKTFSTVFGTNTSFLELLLLERNIKGPCWMEVLNVEVAKSPISWCVIEAETANPSDIMPIFGIAVEECGPPPPLTVLTLVMRTTFDKEGKHKVLSIGGAIRRDFPFDAVSAPENNKTKDETFCILAKQPGVSWPTGFDVHLPDSMREMLICVDSETALLNAFLRKIKLLDPDVVVGHGISDFDLQVIVYNLIALQISQSSCISRLRKNLEARNGKGYCRLKKSFPLSGRLICDTKVSAENLIKSHSYELQTVCHNILDDVEEGLEEQETIDQDKVHALFSKSDSLVKLLLTIYLESHQIIRLMEALNVLPIAMEITKISGYIMSRTLTGRNLERNEFLLLHAFTEQGFIVPDKTYGKKESGVCGSSYKGGLVLEPKAGLYETLILHMDFNSLYPSIIQEYNICFSTLSCDVKSLVDSGELNFKLLQEILPKSESAPGVLPNEFRKLVENRQSIKKLMAKDNISPAKSRQYNIRQIALKLVANSLYGCLGFSGFRFQARHIAALVTAKGREILSCTKDIVQGYFNLKVIYGDTDSVMIDTGIKGDYEAAVKISTKIKMEVNKIYRKVELAREGIFERMLLLKKKKYAALVLEKEGQEFKRRMEIKGIEIVRRDWSLLSKDAGMFVVKQLLNEDVQEVDLNERLIKIASYLEGLKEELQSGNTPIDKLIITKRLTKKPEDYTNPKNLAHVQVALRYNVQSNVRPLMQGDTVQYIICTDGTDNTATYRAYHKEELCRGRRFDNDTPLPLCVDVHYYLAQQVYPVVCRICEPILEMDANRIALCLGLEAVHTPKLLKSTPWPIDDTNVSDIPTFNFEDCNKFSFTCMNNNCKRVNVMSGPYRVRDSSLSYFLKSCDNPQCDVSPLEYFDSIQNELSNVIRNHITQYYQGWLFCDECENQMKRIPVNTRDSLPICPACNSGYMVRKYDELQLFTQLYFYRNTFDLYKVTKDIQKPEGNIPRDIDRAYFKLKDTVNRTLCYSSYSIISLSQLFSHTKKTSFTKISSISLDG